MYDFQIPMYFDSLKCQLFLQSTVKHSKTARGLSQPGYTGYSTPQKG